MGGRFDNTHRMQPGSPSSLQMPSFLHGTFMSVARKTSREGHRCGEQYRRDSSFPPPRERLAVPPGEVVIVHEVVDFQRARPAWRLYMVGNVISAVCEALDWQNSFQVGDLYEEFCCETAWGALYFATSQTAPRSAARMALRLRALLRSWEPLQSARYLFNTPNVALTLDELVTTARDWAMDAWCPIGEGSVRARLEIATERMARATKEDSIDAILRQMPRAFASAHGLKHRGVLADPAFVHKRLEMLAPAAFERVSGACTSDLLGQLYAWDRELEQQ
jgi:hypothetical protein